MQVEVISSPLTVLIMFGWRLMSALSLQDLILGAIFIDKTWVNLKFFYETKLFLGNRT